MYENARKALVKPQNPPNSIDAIIEALRPHLIPDGCVAVCKTCERLPSEAGLCRNPRCPIKPKEPTK